MQSSQKKVYRNLQGITCTDYQLNPMDWSVIIIEEGKYNKYRVKSYNKKLKKRALIEAKSTENASDNLTEEHKKVKAIWEDQIINEDSLQVQMPTFKIPGRFVIDSKWSDKRTSRELVLHTQGKAIYAEYLDIKQAGRIWLEDVFRKN